ncbi:MAG: glycoside hydrolase family 3 N-terminal domain-containing protein, partial [Pelolinea sp.]|nr:glycoside hydrolase family 3 N-terminal domain-containing protein [Pelolinea sp.]
EKRKRSGSLILVVMCLISLLNTSTGYCENEPQNPEWYQKVLQLAAQLSPEEKVGQLFLITFDGNEMVEKSEIFDLISNYYVGGVVLKSENGNFSQNEDALQDLISLISNLQQINFNKQNKIGLLPEIGIVNGYVPLFVGISQPGGSFPYDQIIGGLTPTPSQMAIGATWNVSAAEDAGELIGDELSSLGFNLFFGPSLDVLDITYNEGNENLGVRTFGGDPYWVGEMGAAYISGIHKGSENRIAVISKNFPGRGSSDRLPEEEVATVRKSLEQLQLIELAPFFRVTKSNDQEYDQVTDGLLSSHIRYQGFQGNIRATTKPISFDQNAVDLIMGLSPLDQWRENGGILVSDDLGSQAVYKLFNPNGQFIDARQVARNAFLAGNDLLFMDKLVSTGDENRFETYRRTMELFVQKYKEDQAFAEKIDESLIRILTLKFELYGDFSLANVLPKPADISNLGIGPDIVFEIAKQAATLINPSQTQINETIPFPPQFGERILIFTDDQIVSQCEGCQPQTVFPVNGLQSSILKLYGPSGSGQIGDNQIISYSFNDLSDYVTNSFNRPEIEENLSKAKWVIFALREIDPDQPSSYALHDLLSETSSALREKNILVFSYDVPYYFDATEISAFSAFYCMYSKLPSFIDVSARIIFQEMTPQGASPVSIPGIAYDLMTAMTPDPNQIISLSVDEETAQLLISGLESEQNNTELENTLPAFKLGDILPIKTGVIVDHNNHPVPDGTVVRFSMSEQGSNTSIQQIESTTENGIAKASVVLQNSGLHEIRALSEPALSSQILVLDISEEEAIVSAIIPTPVPTLADITGNDEVGDGIQEVADLIENNKVSEWFLATLLSWLLGAVVFYFLQDYFKVEDRILIAISGVIGGLFNTTWLMLNFPGTSQRLGLNGYFSLFFSVLIGALIGGAGGWVLIQINRNRLKKQ